MLSGTIRISEARVASDLILDQTLSGFGTFAQSFKVDLNADGLSDTVASGTVYEGQPDLFHIYLNVAVLLDDGVGGFLGQLYKLSYYQLLPVAVHPNGDPGVVDLLSASDHYSGADIFTNDGTGRFSVSFQTNFQYLGNYNQFTPTPQPNDRPEDVVKINTDGSITVTPPASIAGYASTVFAAPSGTTLTAVAGVATSGGHFSVALDDSAGDLLIASGDLLTVPCYCVGTRILTDRGEIAVEALQVGDMVMTTLAGRQIPKPVRWLGHRRLGLANHPHPDDTCPIRIRAGALGIGRPHRDLLVSPGHRLRLEDTLVRALDLVNGATIVQERPKTVEYWHVELDTHDILLAEGVEAESYQNVGNRGDFENGRVVVLHPLLDGAGADPCLPYGMPSDALRRSLMHVAEDLGWQRARDPQPWLEVRGRRIEPMRRGNRYRFSLPTGCTEARLHSRASRPCDVDPASTDCRSLGLALVQLCVTGEHGSHVVGVDDAHLAIGFSHVERDEHGWAWRWTQGEAVLPLAAWVGCNETVTLEVVIDEQTLLFWVPPSCPRLGGSGAAKGLSRPA